MRLSIDCRMWHASGIGTYLRNLVPHLMASFSDSEIFLLGKEKDLQDIASAENRNVVIIPCHSSIYSIAEQFELAREIPGRSLFFSPQYNIPLLYRGTQITAIHDIFHIVEENNDNSIARRLYARTMLSAALRKSKIVFTDSHYTLSEMGKYNLPHLEKVIVVPLSSPFENHDFINEINGNDQQHILFVGNIKPHKNLVRLVEAYKILCTKHGLSLPLQIVGEAENLMTGIPGFKTDVGESSWGSRIRFTGRINQQELIRLYKDAALLVLPSLYEGFGLPPLEAMACGCPVVVSRAASLPEVCGDAAVYCDPYDVNDIAEKMRVVIADEGLRENLISAGHRQVAKYSWARTASEYVRQIETVM